MEQQGYKSATFSAQQEELDCMMDIKLMQYSSGEAEYEVSLFDTKARKHIYRGNLQETIELILLGKLHKQQLQAIDKKEPVAEQPVPQASL